MKKISVIIFFFGIVLLVAFAKAPPKSQETLMSEYINEKLQQSEKKQWKNCHDNTIKDAVAFVDSIIYSQNDLIDLDSVKTPAKPIKPTKPFDTLKLDTSPIIPILLEEKSSESLDSLDKDQFNL